MTTTKREHSSKHSKYTNATTFTEGDTRTSEIAAIGGAVKSEAKGQAARANGASGGRKAKAPADRECQCGMGNATLPQDHKYACPRSRAWRRQQEKADSMIA